MNESLRMVVQDKTYLLLPRALADRARPAEVELRVPPRESDSEELVAGIAAWVGISSHRVPIDSEGLTLQPLLQVTHIDVNRSAIVGKEITRRCKLMLGIFQPIIFRIPILSFVDIRALHNRNRVHHFLHMRIHDAVAGRGSAS